MPTETSPHDFWQNQCETYKSYLPQRVSAVIKRVLEKFEITDQGKLQSISISRDQHHQAVTFAISTKGLNTFEFRVGKFMDAMFAEGVTSAEREEVAKAINKALGKDENDASIAQYANNKEKFTDKLTADIKEHEKYQPDNLENLLKDAREQTPTLSDNSPLKTYKSQYKMNRVDLHKMASDIGAFKRAMMAAGFEPQKNEKTEVPNHTTLSFSIPENLEPAALSLLQQADIHQVKERMRRVVENAGADERQEVAADLQKFAQELCPNNPEVTLLFGKPEGNPFTAAKTPFP